MVGTRSLPGWILLATFGVAALALPAGAQNVAGSGMLLAKNKLAAKGCGRAKLTESETLALEADGTWTVTFDGSGMIGGTYTPLGAKGRKFDLALDAPTLADVRTSLGEDLSELCQTQVVVTTIDTKHFRLKLNRAATKATLKLKLKLAGTADGQSGKGSFKVKAKGPWTAGPGSPSGAFLDD